MILVYTGQKQLFSWRAFLIPLSIRNTSLLKFHPPHLFHLQTASALTSFLHKHCSPQNSSLCKLNQWGLHPIQTLSYANFMHPFLFPTRTTSTLTSSLHKRNLPRSLPYANSIYSDLIPTQTISTRTSSQSELHPPRLLSYVYFLGEITSKEVALHVMAHNNMGYTFFLVHFFSVIIRNIE